MIPLLSFPARFAGSTLLCAERSILASVLCVYVDALLSKASFGLNKVIQDIAINMKDMYVIILNDAMSSTLNMMSS